MAERERPILFSGPMVRAILEGRKTQTRRVIKPAPGDHPDDEGDVLYRCPYGIPGDGLWVREKAKLRAVCGGVWVDLLFAADEKPVEFQQKNSKPFRATSWTPSIHMPRWASRISLEVLKIRVERVQDISEADAVAEGAMAVDSETMQTAARAAAAEGQITSVGPRDYFRWLWESINAARGFGWKKNPWVWVIDFRRATT